MSRPVPPVLSTLLPLLAGALFPLGLAPFDIWPAIPTSAALWLWCLHHQVQRASLLIGWLYGLGVFGTGASWVYVSIHEHGHAPIPLAVLLTLIFCAGLALLFGLQAVVYRRGFKLSHWSAPALAFPALWVLFEWLRSWLLTGFPWLFAGYAGLDTFLSGLAPVFGVYAVSFWLVSVGSTAAALAWYRRDPNGPRDRRPLVLTLALLLIVAGASYSGQQRDWTVAAGDPLSVGLYQPNIPQAQKWDRRYRQRIFEQFESNAASLLPKVDVLLWPESALPAVRERIEPLLEQLNAQAQSANSSLISGLVVREEGALHNSLLGLGEASGEYHKQRLVPFGEYVPLEQWLRGLITFFDLPMSSFQPGPSQQPPLRAGAWQVAPFICYEVVYPDFVAEGARDSHLLITVSNDTWFGASIGPLQHLQMARFRALETGRPMLRGTNNGISAIIDHHGKLLAQSPQFVEATLRGQLIPREGDTPYMLTGSLPILSLSALIVAVFGRWRRA